MCAVAITDLPHVWVLEGHVSGIVNLRDKMLVWWFRDALSIQARMRSGIPRETGEGDVCIAADADAGSTANIELSLTHRCVRKSNRDRLLGERV